MDQATIEAISNKIIAETDLQVALIGLVGAVIGGAFALVGQFIMHKLTFSKEIRLKLIENEIKNFNEVEAIVGSYVEELCSYKTLNEEKYSELSEKLNEFIGKFKRHNDLAQAIRNVSQYGMILRAERVSDPTARQERHDLDEKHKEFVVQLLKSYKSIGAA
jgi:excinuclease UvrABC helicase subunit UvrB